MASSLGRAVASTLELLAGYSYHPSPDPESSDPALSQLVPLGDAAKILIQERNVLRSQLGKLNEQLHAQTKNMQVYSAHLAELVRRVRALPQEEIVESLLQDIEIPRPEDVSEAVISLLQTSCELRTQSRHSRKASESSLVLEDRTELPVINSFLDRAWEKARKSVESYAKLELSEEPTIYKAWDSIEQDLTEKLAEDHPLTELIRLKAEALCALKTVESISLEEALIGSQRLKSRLETMIAESESWVVTELFHERIPSTQQLQAAIARRVQLISEPMTLANLKELSDIYEEYEMQRKSATLQPWIERVQPELEWWKLVNLAKQVVSASEQTYHELAPDYWTLSDFRSSLDPLQRELTTDTEGVYNYLYSLLDELRRLESLKKNALCAGMRDVDVENVRDLLHSYMDCAAVFATFGEESLEESLRIEGLLNAVDCDVFSLIKPAKTLVRGHLAEWKSAIAGKLSLSWLYPVLLTCIDSLSDNSTLRQQLETELRFIETEDGGLYCDHIRTIAECITATVECLRNGVATQRKISDAEVRARSEEIEGVRNDLENAVFSLSSGCIDLASIGDSSFVFLSESVQSQIESASDIYSKVRLLETAISLLCSALKDSRVELNTQRHQLTQELTASIQSTESSLAAEVNALFPALTSLCEVVEKPGLVAGCNQATQRGSLTADLVAKLQSATRTLCALRSTIKPKFESVDNFAVIRKLKHALDLSGRNAEDLAKGSTDPENEAKTREAVQNVINKAAEGTVGELLEAMADMLEIEREQVALRLTADFTEVAAIAEAAIPPKPNSRLQSAPAVDRTLEQGLDYLSRTVSSLLTDFGVSADEDLRTHQIQKIAESSGVERLLLIQGKMHAELRQLQASEKSAIERRTARLQEMLEMAARLTPDSQSKEKLLARVDSLRTELLNSGKSPYALVEDAELLLNSRLKRLTMPLEARGDLVAGVQRLLSVYEGELPLHNVQLLCTADEERIMMEGDIYSRAAIHLELMDKGLKALSERASFYRQELRRTKDYITASAAEIVDCQMQVLKVLSESECSDLWSKLGPFEADIEKGRRAVVHTRDIVMRLHDQLKKVNRLREPQDVFGHIEVLIARSHFNPASTAPISRSSDPQSDQQKDQESSALEVVDADLSDTVACVADTMQAMKWEHWTGPIATADEELLAVVQKKLAYVKSALYYMRNAQWTVAYRHLRSLLTSVREMVKDQEKVQMIDNLLEKTEVESQKENGQISTCVEEMETLLGGIMDGLGTVNPPEVEPGNFDQLLELADQLAVPFSAPDTPQDPSPHSGKPQLLHAKLHSTHAAIVHYFQSLFSKLLAQIRALAACQSRSEELEPLVAEIEQHFTDHGATSSLVLNIEEVVDCLVTDAVNYQQAIAANEQALMGSTVQWVAALEKVVTGEVAEGQLLVNQRLERLYSATATTLADMFSRLSASVRSLAVPHGLETLSSIEIQHQTADMEAVAAVLGLVESLLAECKTSGSHSEEAVDSGRKRLSSAQSAGDRLAKGFNYLSGVAEELMLLLGVSDSNPQRLAALQSIQSSSGQERLILQQTQLYLDLSTCKICATDRFSTLISAFSAITTALSPALPERSGTVVGNCQRKVERKCAARDGNFSDLQLWVETIEGALTTAPLRSNSDTAPLADIHDRFALVQQDAETLLSAMELQQIAVETTEKLRETAVTSSQRLDISQSLISGELQSAAERLKSTVSTLLRNAVSVLLSLNLTAEQHATVGRLSEAGNPQLSDVLCVLQEAQMAVKSYVPYEEVAEDAVLVEAVEDRKTRLSAVQSAGDKVSKGMEFLVKTAEKINTQLEVDMDLDAPLQAISNATGQDKLILQQTLLHQQLREIMRVTANREKVPESADFAAEELDSIYRESLSVLSELGKPLTAELQNLTNCIETDTSDQRGMMQKEVVFGCFARIREEVNAGREEKEIARNTAARVEAQLADIAGENGLKSADLVESLVAMERLLLPISQKLACIDSSVLSLLSSLSLSPNHTSAVQEPTDSLLSRLTISVETAVAQITSTHEENLSRYRRILREFAFDDLPQQSESELLATVEAQIQRFKERCVEVVGNNETEPLGTVVEVLGKWRERLEVGLKDVEMVAECLQTAGSDEGLETVKRVIDHGGDISHCLHTALRALADSIPRILSTLSALSSESVVTSFQQAFAPFVELPPTNSFPDLLQSVLSQIDSCCAKLCTDAAKPRRLSFCLSTAVHNKEKLVTLETRLNEIMSTIEGEDEEPKLGEANKKMEEMRQRERDLQTSLADTMKEELQSISLAGAMTSLNLLCIDPRFESVQCRLLALQQYCDSFSCAKTTEEVVAVARRLIKDYVAAELACCRAVTWPWKLRDVALPPFLAIKEFVALEEQERRTLAEARGLQISDTSFTAVFARLEKETRTKEVFVRQALTLLDAPETADIEEEMKRLEHVLADVDKVQELQEVARRLKAPAL